MIQINKSKELEFQQIAELHFKKLNENLLPTRLKLFKEFCESNNFQELYKIIQENLKIIICGKPNELEKVISKVEKLLPNEEDRKQELLRKISSVFNYGAFSEKQEDIGKWDAYRLVEKLGVNSCPYCNCQYTFTIIDEDKNEKIVRPPLDHFFAHSIYPYLAISFYNLIPACAICNSTFKRDVEFDLENFIHPYIEEFGFNAKFTFIPDSYEDLIGISKSHNSKTQLRINPDIDSSLKNRINNNIAIFHLDDIYSQHDDYIKEMIRKQIIASGAYLDMLLKQYPDAFQSKEELYQFAFGNFPNEEDFHKRPLSKLTHDIAEELGLI